MTGASSSSEVPDPRMKGFQSRTEVADVLALLENRIQPLPAAEIESVTAATRVLADQVSSPRDMPPFDRSAMDGYAVKGEETFGASEYSLLSFEIVGDARPGRPFPGRLDSGQAVRIMTGAPMPPGFFIIIIEFNSFDDVILFQLDYFELTFHVEHI